MSKTFKFFRVVAGSIMDW